MQNFFQAAYPLSSSPSNKYKGKWCLMDATPLMLCCDTFEEFLAYQVGLADLKNINNAAITEY